MATLKSYKRALLSFVGAGEGNEEIDIKAIFRQFPEKADPNILEFPDGLKTRPLLHILVDEEEEETFTFVV